MAPAGGGHAIATSRSLADRSARTDSPAGAAGQAGPSSSFSIAATRGEGNSIFRSGPAAGRACADPAGGFASSELAAFFDLTHRASSCACVDTTSGAGSTSCVGSIPAAGAGRGAQATCCRLARVAGAALAMTGDEAPACCGWFACLASPARLGGATSARRDETARVMIAVSDHRGREAAAAGARRIPPGPVLISGISSPCCSASAANSAIFGSAGVQGKTSHCLGQTVT